MPSATAADAVLAPGSTSRAERTTIIPVAFAALMAVAVVVLIAVVIQQRGTPANSAEARAAAINAPAPICAGVAEADHLRLTKGFEQVRRTDEGTNLYVLLIDHDVCVDVASIPYNCGYARANRGFFGGWSRSEIVVAEECLRIIGPDVTAALLVHEATHLSRAIAGEGCVGDRSCESLDNGVQVEEEMAAHAAEARWWIAIYGPGGRRVWSGITYSLDNLAAAYQRGPEAFRDFVISIRSDPEEGVGI